MLLQILEVSRCSQSWLENQLPIDQSYQKNELNSLNSFENSPHLWGKKKKWHSLIFNILFLVSSLTRKKKGWEKNQGLFPQETKALPTFLSFSEMLLMGF